MAVCASVLTREEAALNELSGVDFQHDLHLSAPDWAAWLEISERLLSAGAEVRALQLMRVGIGFDVRCRLKNISAAAARALLDGLLSEGIAERGAVEHLVLSARGAP